MNDLGRRRLNEITRKLCSCLPDIGEGGASGDNRSFELRTMVCDGAFLSFFVLLRCFDFLGLVCNFAEVSLGKIDTRGDGEPTTGARAFKATKAYRTVAPEASARMQHDKSGSLC